MTVEEKKAAKAAYDRDYRKKNKAKRAEQNRKWLAANPGKQAEYDKRCYDKNPEKRKSCSRQYKADNPEKVAAAHRARRLKAIYGISVAEYDQMLTDQGGRCALCRTDTPRGMGTFHVDHCHDTGAVRALLCSTCNTGIGHLQHNPDLLIKAAEYIQHHRKLQDAA
jgi:hypothetical protein